MINSKPVGYINLSKLSLQKELHIMKRENVLRTFVVGFILIAFLGVVSFSDQGERGFEPVAQLAPQGDFQVEVKTDKKAYRIGESGTISVKSQKPGYLTIYDLNPDGRVYVIYPNKYQSQQRINANKTYQIPPPGAKYELRVAEPTGTDMLVAIVTDKPGIMPLTDRIKEELFPRISTDPDEFTRGFKPKLKKSKEWGLGFCTYQIQKGEVMPTLPPKEGWMYQAYRQQVVGGVTTSWPIAFNPDNTNRWLGSYWLKHWTFNHWFKWKFKVVPSLTAAQSVLFNFNLLVTDSIEGGQGYETSIIVTLQVLRDGTIVHKQQESVKLNNPTRPKDPTYSHGDGYKTNGVLQVSPEVISLLRNGDKLLVLVKRNPSVFDWDCGCQPIVGANSDSITLKFK